MKKVFVVAGVIGACWLAVLVVGYGIIQSISALLDSDD
jgi:hypothetical protein